MFRHTCRIKGQDPFHVLLSILSRQHQFGLGSLAFGLWPLVFGLWSLAFGLWSWVFEYEGQRPKTKDQSPMPKSNQKSKNNFIRISTLPADRLSSPDAPGCNERAMLKPTNKGRRLRMSADRLAELRIRASR